MLSLVRLGSVKFSSFQLISVHFSLGLGDFGEASYFAYAKLSLSIAGMKRAWS